MIRRSMDTVDEQRIAKVFGVKSIRYRLAPNLLQHLHPDVVQAFQNELISRTSAQEFGYVKPARQLKMLDEMKTTGDYGPSFARALVLQTPRELRSKRGKQRQAWTRSPKKRKELVARLQAAEKQHGFYGRLYRQYTTDLMKMSFHVRQIVRNDRLRAYLEANSPETLARFDEILFETQT